MASDEMISVLQFPTSYLQSQGPFNPRPSLVVSMKHTHKEG